MERTSLCELSGADVPVACDSGDKDVGKGEWREDTDAVAGSFGAGEGETLNR